MRNAQSGPGLYIHPQASIRSGEQVTHVLHRVIGKALQERLKGRQRLRPALVRLADNAPGGDGFVVAHRLHRHRRPQRSEEHTSELQSHHDLVCRLLLEKKKKKTKSRTFVQKKKKKTKIK